MYSKNLSLCWWPTIVRPAAESIHKLTQDGTGFTLFFTTIIDKYYEIFTDSVIDTVIETKIETKIDTKIDDKRDDNLKVINEEIQDSDFVANDFLDENNEQSNSSSLEQKNIKSTNV